MTAKKQVRVYIIYKGEAKMCAFDPDDVVVSDVLARDAFGLPLDLGLEFTGCIAFADEPGVTHRWDFNCKKSISATLNSAITLGAATCPPRAPHALVFLGVYTGIAADSVVREWRGLLADTHAPPTPAAHAMATPGLPRLSTLVRLYIIDPAGQATYIGIYTDTEFTEEDYIGTWQNRLFLSPAEIKQITAGQYRVPARGNATGADITWHTGTIPFSGDPTASVREAMQKAVKFMPDHCEYGLVFLKTGVWNDTQKEAARAIAEDLRKRAGRLSDPVPAEPAKATVRAPPPANTAETMRFYYIDQGGGASLVELDKRELDHMDREEWIWRWQKALNCHYARADAMAWRSADPTSVAQRVFHPAVRVPLEHDCIASALLEHADICRIASRALARAPTGASYGVAFLRGGEYTTAGQFATMQAILEEQRGRSVPVPVAVTPLMRWYTARTEYKAAEEDLLGKLNAALIEKGKDPALNDGLIAALDPVVSEELDRLAGLESGTVCDCHPIRTAAYETVGLAFGPPIPRPTHGLAGICAFGGGKPTRHQARRLCLPWHEQK